MDHRLREIEQWVAEARDGLGDGGREAYVRKLYLLDAEIRAVIKDSGILPPAVSPRPAVPIVRRFESLGMPVAGVLVVLLAVATVYLRSGAVPGMGTQALAPVPPGINTDTSILTARPESAQKNTPPAGPSSTPQDWHEYLAANGEVLVQFPAAEAAEQPAQKPVLLASAVGVAPARPATGKPQVEPVKGGAVKKDMGDLPVAATTPPQRAALPASNDSTNVASGGIILAGFSPAPVEKAAESTEKPETTKAVIKKGKNRKAAAEKEAPALDLAALEADFEKTFEK